MALEVRTIHADEVELWTAALRHGFLDTPRPGEGAFWFEQRDLGRTRGAFDGDGIVGTLRSFASELTMPGGTLLPVSALTNVTVTATHRRQGLLRRMISEDLRDSAERGESASILIASEYPIYGRFGYGPATEVTDWEVDCQAARFREPGAGTVNLVAPDEARRVAPMLWDRVRRARPGGITRDDFFWDLVTGVRQAPQEEKSHRLWVVCREAGEPSGYAVYTIDKKWESYRPLGVLEVRMLAAATPAAEARLWRYCCEVDWIGTVKATTRPVDEVLPWLLVDARAARQTMRNDMTWVRPLDPARVLESRCGGAPGHIVLEVADPDGYANGRFEWTTSPEGSECRPSTASADLALSAAMLGAASLGGTSLLTLARAGLIEELAPGAVDRAAAMLAWPAPPWTGLWF